MDETHAAPAATSRGQRRPPWLVPGVLALILAFLTVSVLAHSPVLYVDGWIRGAVQAQANSARFRWLEGYRYAPVYLLADLGNNQVAVSVLGLSALIAAIRDRSMRPLLAAGCPWRSGRVSVRPLCHVQRLPGSCRGAARAGSAGLGQAIRAGDHG